MCRSIVSIIFYRYISEVVLCVLLHYVYYCNQISFLARYVADSALNFLMPSPLHLNFFSDVGNCAKNYEKMTIFKPKLSHFEFLT
jgi:hypothetical protein